MRIGNICVRDPNWLRVRPIFPFSTIESSLYCKCYSFPTHWKAILSVSSKNSSIICVCIWCHLSLSWPILLVVDIEISVLGLFPGPYLCSGRYLSLVTICSVLSTEYPYSFWNFWHFTSTPQLYTYSCFYSCSHCRCVKILLDQSLIPFLAPLPLFLFLFLTSFSFCYHDALLPPFSTERIADALLSIGPSFDSFVWVVPVPIPFPHLGCCCSSPLPLLYFVAVPICVDISVSSLGFLPRLFGIHVIRPASSFSHGAPLLVIVYCT